MKSRQSRDAMFFQRTVKALYIDSSCDKNECTDLKQAIEAIIATCTGLTSFGYHSEQKDAIPNPAHGADPASSLHAILHFMFRSLAPNMIAIDFHDLPTSITRLHCKSSQLARWMTDGGFFARFPCLTHINLNCQLFGDDHVFRLLEEPLPEIVELCVYKIQSVSGAVDKTYNPLNRALRALKDPRVVVLVHPSFRFPLLPNLIHYEGRDSRRHRRKQLEWWTEAEQFAESYVQGLRAGGI
ncbi:hypothetical protein BDZ89DRAFT_280477 [Hymenopellis radicata]|nr:hypothetical protein BDZ89DRAFT_280477 [Hymenopellis radicata]